MLKKFNYKNHMQPQVAQRAIAIFNSKYIHNIIYIIQVDEQCVKGVGSHSHIV